MNAIDLLEKQHEETLSALTTLEESKPGAERKQLFKKMQLGLLGHMVIEEEMFYPAAVEASDAEKDPVAEGYEEHMSARECLMRCELALSEKDLFGVRIGVLKELIEHHVKEERRDLFPIARKVMSTAQLEALGAAMEQRFRAAQRERTAATKLNRFSTEREKHTLSM